MRRFAWMAGLMMAANLCIADMEVYLAVRADGRDGTGTIADPFDAGTQGGMIVNNMVFDAGPLPEGSEGINEIVDEKVPTGPGQHADLLICPVNR